MQVTFWGVRGSIPGCNSNQQQVGGHTSCVSVESDNQVIVFDGGTGLTNFAEWVLRSHHRDIHLLLSHGHFDHILGIPFFKPFWNPDFRIHLYSGPLCNALSLKDFIKNQLFVHPLFPVTFDHLRASIQFHDLKVGNTFKIGTSTIQTIGLNHPGHSTGFRLNQGQKSVCYLSDMEHSYPSPQADLVTFVKGTDLLIYDATYTNEEYADHKGWGHSTWQEGAKLAKAGYCKRVGFYHHDASHSDQQMQEIERVAQKIFKGAFVARQNQQLVL